MTAHDYLSHAKFLDARIDSKLKQLDHLNALATSATAALSGMPHNPNRGASKLETVIVKIVDLQEEINQDIDELVDLKRAIMRLIQKVPSDEQRAVLEKRYLNYQSWEQIVGDLGYSRAQLFRIKNKAIDFCDQILKDETKKY